MELGVQTYKCPHCNGAVTFDIASQTWTCAFCLSELTLDELQGDETLEEAYAQEEYPIASGDDFAQGTHAYTCPSCGAGIVTEKTTAATFCVFCQNPAILPDRVSGDLMPRRIMPFRRHTEDAKSAFLGLCKGKWLLPRAFKNDAHMDEIRGMYVPFWLYSCDCEGEMAADCANEKTWTSGDYEYTETQHYHAERAGTASFDGVPADGSRRMDDAMMRALEPFDYAQLEQFQMRHLTGHLAERYDVNENAAFPAAEARIKEGMAALLQKTIKGYDSVSVRSHTETVSNLRSEYVMLPIWMLTTVYKNKKFVFAMNGQTGKLVGDLPISILKTVLFGVGFAAIVILLLGLLEVPLFPLFGLVIGAIPLILMVSSHNHGRRRPPSASNYLDGDGLNLTTRTDFYTHTTTDKRKISSDD